MMMFNKSSSTEERPAVEARAYTPPMVTDLGGLAELTGDLGPYGPPPADS
jgi:hypothetical protein